MQKCFLTYLLLALLIVSCRNESQIDQVSEDSVLTTEIVPDETLNSNIAFQSLINDGQPIVSYIVKAKEYGKNIGIDVEQLVSDYSKLETLWNAYQLVENSETLDAATDLAIGITSVLDQYIARNIEEITDATVLDYVIKWYEERIKQSPSSENLIEKLNELRNRKESINERVQEQSLAHHLFKCGDISNHNKKTPNKARFSAIRGHYRKVDDAEFASELGLRSITDFINYIQYDLDEDSFITSQELRLVREYAYNLICCRSCKYEDRFETMDRVSECFNSFSRKFERMEESAKEIRISKRIKM